MRHKRSLLTVICLIIVGVLGQSAMAKVVLEFSHWGTNLGIESTWEKFNQSQDEIEVVFRPIGWDEYVERIMIEMATGEGPDLFSLMGWDTADMNFRTMVRDSLLLDLSPYFERDKQAIGADEWLPFVTPLASYQGRLAGLPYGWSVFNAINYNADLFDEFGIAYPDETWTWEIMESTSRAFIRTDGEGNVLTRGLHPDDLGWWGAEAMIWSAGGQVFNESQTALALNRPESREALERAARMVNEEAAVEGPDWGDPSSAVAFRLAPVHWATADKPQYDVQFRTGIAVTPMDSSTGLRTGNSVEVMLTGVNSNTKHPNEAWEALKFFTEHFAEASLEAWGLVQFIPVSTTGLEVFLTQGADILGDPFATDILSVVPQLADTVRLPEEPVNPVLVDYYPEIQNILSVEWGRVVDPADNVTVAQFIENVSGLIHSRLSGN